MNNDYHTNLTNSSTKQSNTVFDHLKLLNSHNMYVKGENKHLESLNQTIKLKENQTEGSRPGTTLLKNNSSNKVIMQLNYFIVSVEQNNHLV